ncbi:hypothetical protein [Streptomyces lydicus]|uniref:hypothetical protein n=1 Tax=Streptomyces lydicus TaxID=47763 RepID=UPI0013E913E8|nr:hypothetical protein [Streptomyces lydicus]MCZ1009923.1 hypothetical protein [Streptomyces lydicus]
MSAFDFDPGDLDEDTLDALDEMTDDELAELFDDQDDGEPELMLLAGYGRPANRRPPVIDPHRRLEDLPPIDTFTPPARTTARTQ